MSFRSTRYYKQAAMSVCGGAGGYGTKISLPRMSYMTPSLNLSDGLDLHVGANEKATMQNLNDRLATYLEKVHKLEKDNDRLEKLIIEWNQSRTVVSHDHSAYFATIYDLKEKIRVATKLNAKIILDIDNSKLATEDFRIKYDNELTMRMAVEADIAGLRKAFDDLNLIRMDLENQYESLKDELIMLKKNHEEELTLMRAQMGGQVNVAVDASPSTDLNEAMKEIREYYEGVIARNNKEIETWFQTKIAVAQQEVISQNEILLTSRTEIKELKSILQKLQIELQSHLSMRESLEGTLSETQARYATQLAKFQTTVTSLEVQLSEIHTDITHTKQEYDILLDLKTRLEIEIAEYRRLLDGEDESLKQVITKVITVVETVVDGKVVESSKTVDVDVDQVE